MNKLQNVLLNFFIILFCISTVIQASDDNESITTQSTIHGLGFQGAIMNEDYRQTAAASTQNGSCANGTCCPFGQKCCANGCSDSDNTNNSNFSIPPFTIQIAGANGQTVLNTSTSNTTGKYFNIPSSFNLTNAILTVHIFPPSNIISSTAATTATYASGKEAVYTVFYTLKDPAGTMIYSDYSVFTPPANDMVHFINILPTAASTNASLASIPPVQGSSFACQAIFFPAGTNLSAGSKQIILNGISPITQKFLLQMTTNTDTTQNNTATASISISQISGTYDSDDSQTYKGLSALPTATATTGTNINSLSVSFDNGQSQTITFENQSTPVVPFTTQDLANGLILNVVIFPSVQNSGNYPIIATLRTIDGLKMRKKHLITQSPLSNIPTTITLQHGSNNTNLLTTSFLSSQISSDSLPTIFTIISPLNLRFLITRPVTGGNFMVLMV